MPTHAHSATAVAPLDADTADIGDQSSNGEMADVGAGIGSDARPVTDEP